MDADAARRGGAGPADRLRERRQPDARAGDGSGARDGHSRGARREPMASDARPARSKGSCCRWPARAIGIVLAYGRRAAAACLAAEPACRALRRLGWTSGCSSPRCRPRCSTGVFFGIVPALHSSRPDLTTTLKDSGRSSTVGRSQSAAARRAGDCRSRAGGRPARRCGALHRQLRAPDACRPGLRLPQRARAQRRPAVRLQQARRSTKRLLAAGTRLPRADARRGEPRSRGRDGGNRQRRPAADRKLEPDRDRDARTRRAQGQTTTRSTSGP